MPKPILRSDVLEMKDLTPGMVLKGTVRNVIDFGAFVDIGVHQDGLVHISEICDRYISHPLEAVSVGDIVDVQVLSVDLKKQRIQLTMKIGTGGDGAKDNDSAKNKDQKPDKDKKKSGNGGQKFGDQRRGGNPNRSGQKKPDDRKRGNHFFDGIVIK
jgi:uncharacterized protein